MCFCESDAVNILLHVKARKRYPGIKFHEPTLAKVARRFDIKATQQIRTMNEPQLEALAAALLQELPASACPIEYRALAG